MEKTKYHFFPVYGDKREVNNTALKLDANKPAYIQELIGYNLWRLGEHARFVTIGQYNLINRGTRV